jgi:hypothetical protein
MSREAYTSKKMKPSWSCASFWVLGDGSAASPQQHWTVALAPLISLVPSQSSSSAKT